MIIQLIINFIVLVLSTALSWLPDVKALPTIGGLDMDYYFSLGTGYFHYIERIFPPLAVIATAATIYLTWRGIVLVLKLVLGHRVPTQH